MIEDIDREVINRHELPIGLFYFYKNLVISEINEGITLNFDNSKELFYLIKEYFGSNIPFVYIANRINSYSFEPTDHFKTEKLFSNGIGYGVVTYDIINYKIAELEQSFLNAPTKIFHTIDEALSWADELIARD